MVLTRSRIEKRGLRLHLGSLGKGALALLGPGAPASPHLTIRALDSGVTAPKEMKPFHSN